MTTARAWRENSRQTQRENSQLRLYQQLGMGLFQNGWTPQTTQEALDAFCTLMGAAHGIVARQEGHTLQVLASRGQTFPPGARVPIMGALAQLLRPAETFGLHTIETTLWSYNRSNPVFPFLTPIQYAGQPIGLFGFVTVKSSLNAEETALCHSLCGFLGLALSKQETTTATQADRSILNALTPREREIFALLPSGHSNAELAEKLGIAPGTVKIHVERILSKLNLRDRTQAAVKAVELGYSPH